MRVKARDKRLKEIMRQHPKPVVSLAGLGKGIPAKIQVIITQLLAAPNLSVVCSNNFNWRCHQWKGKKIWSIDVQGPTRLLFDYDSKTHEISRMIYHDPH